MKPVPITPTRHRLCVPESVTATSPLANFEFLVFSFEFRSSRRTLVNYLINSKLKTQN